MADYICTKCHYIGKPKTKKRGSTKTESFGWMVFPLGVPYTLWRMLNKIKLCWHCDTETVVKVDSLQGSIIIAKMEGELASARLNEQKPKPVAAAPANPPAPPKANEW